MPVADDAPIPPALGKSRAISTRSRHRTFERMHLAWLACRTLVTPTFLSSQPLNILLRQDLASLGDVNLLDLIKTETRIRLLALIEADRERPLRRSDLHHRNNRAEGVRRLAKGHK